MKNNSSVKYVQTGPPYAVINISKLGLRYFRLFIKATPSSKDKLIKNFFGHPNIGWIFSGKSWCNIAIGIWASDNDEINDISASIRNLLSSKDKIVYQSELTALYGFNTLRPVTQRGNEMRIIDAVIKPAQLDQISIDYLKILTIDSSLSKNDYASILGTTASKINELDKKLLSSGIIVGYQDRVNYLDRYYKVFIDSANRVKKFDIDKFIKKLWGDKKCIYFEKANGKYDIEFEIILKNNSILKQKYLKGFFDYKIIELKHIYTNLYPLSKVANLKDIQDATISQTGKIIDLRNSKLWYLNYEGVEAYLDIYKNKEYMELMEKSELELFDKVASFLNKENPKYIYYLIDLGSGNGFKGKIFIQKIGESKIKGYFPVDIQPIELSYVLATHKEAKYATHPVLLDFGKLSSRFPLKVLPKEKQIYAFLGGTYSNFSSGEINSYLSTVYNDNSSVLIISMPLRVSKKRTINSYANMSYEDLAFAPLKHIGFKKRDFIINKEYSRLIVQINLEENCVISSFILKKNVKILGREFKTGTIFKMTTSWKPTLEEFRLALEKDFKIKKIFSNKKFAIAVCQKS